MPRHVIAWAVDRIANAYIARTGLGMKIEIEIVEGDRCGQVVETGKAPAETP